MWLLYEEIYCISEFCMAHFSYNTSHMQDAVDFIWLIPSWVPTILKKNLDFMNGEQVLVVLTMSDKNLVENITLKG